MTEQPPLHNFSVVATGLTKKFGELTAVDNISLQVR